MKTMNFLTEKETSKKVFELMSKGVDFRVVGRKSIIIL